MHTITISQTARRAAIAASMSLLSLAIATGVPARAQTFSGFISQTWYDTGYDPSVAVNGDGQVVEVHNGVQGAGPLWYHVGQATVLPKGPQFSWYPNGHSYDTGFNPAVALWSNFAIEVHMGTTGVAPLWYRIGNVVNDTIDWYGGSQNYDQGGSNPQIAVAYLKDTYAVVEVHNGGSGLGELWYRTGTLDFINSVAPVIHWNQSEPFETSGLNPSVALFGDGTVVVVDNETGTPGGPLRYRIGYVTVASGDYPAPLNPVITFEPSVTYGTGWNPKIASLPQRGPNGNGIEIHSTSGGGPASYQVYGPIIYSPAIYNNFAWNSSVAIAPVSPAASFTSNDYPGSPYDPFRWCTQSYVGLWTVEVHNDSSGFGNELSHFGYWSCNY
jgi:hypothetical protein